MPQPTEAKFIIKADDKTRAGILSVTNKLERLQDSASRFNRTLGTALPFAAAGAVAGIGALTVSAVNSAREIRNLSFVANESEENFQKLAYGSERYGVSQEKLADILKDTNDKIGDFLITGAGPLADFFESIAPQVGVTADQFRNLSGSDALQLYVKSLEKANVSQEQMTFFMEAIASDATLLLPLLKDGGAAFRQLGEEAEVTNNVLSSLDVENLNRLGDGLDQLKQTTRGLGNQIVTDMLPALNDAVDAITLAYIESGFLEAAWVALGAAGNAVFNGSLKRDIQEVEEKIRNLQKANGEFSLLNPETGFSKDYTDEIAELQAELTKLQAEQAAIDEQQQKALEERNRQRQEELRLQEEAYKALQKRREEEAAGQEAAREAERQANAERNRQATQANAESGAISNLQRQIALLGVVTNEERVLAEIRSGAYADYSTATQQRLLALAREQDAIESVNEAERKRLEQQQLLKTEIASIYEATRTPQEQYIEETQRLNELLDAGAFDEAAGGVDTYWRAVQQAAERLPGFREEVEQTRDSMSIFAEQAGRNIQDAFADFLFDPFDKGLKGMLQSFSDTLRRMVAEAAAADILQGLGNWGNANSGSLFGNLASALFGGSRDSGGRGYPGMAYAIGTGAQPEMFIPDTAGTFIPNANRAGGITVNNHFNISAPGGTVSRESQMQVASAAGASINRAVRRNT